MNEHLPDQVLDRVYRLAEHFEASLAPNRPVLTRAQFEEFVDELQDDLQQFSVLDEHIAKTAVLELFAHLISDEVTYRRNNGRRPPIKEYLDRYDVKFAPLIHDVFAKLPLRVGDHLDNFELVELLGEGGMGTVWKAKVRTAEDTFSALKIINTAEMSLDARSIEYFKREISVTGQLTGIEYVVHFHYTDEAEGYLFYAMEYIDGPSLQDELDELLEAQNAALPAANGSVRRTKQHRTVMEPRLAVRRLLEAAKGVHLAHEHGHLHRDIKPANILLKRPDGKRSAVSTEQSHSERDGHQKKRPSKPVLAEQAVVADFGLTKALATTDQNELATGYYSGTEQYRAPEVENRGAPTQRSDIYSLGATLAAVLVGHPPVRPAEGPKAQFASLYNGDVPKLSKDLGAICVKCLQANPESRYKSAQAVADDLERFLEGKPVDARPVWIVEREVRRCLRNPFPTGLMLALIIAAVLAVSFARSWNAGRLEQVALRLSEKQSEGWSPIVRDAMVDTIRQLQWFSPAAAARTEQTCVDRELRDLTADIEHCDGQKVEDFNTRIAFLDERGCDKVEYLRTLIAMRMREWRTQIALHSPYLNRDAIFDAKDVKITSDSEGHGMLRVPKGYAITKVSTNNHFEATRHFR